MQRAQQVLQDPQVQPETQVLQVLLELQVQLDLLAHKVLKVLKVLREFKELRETPEPPAHKERLEFLLQSGQLFQVQLLQLQQVEIQLHTLSLLQRLREITRFK